MQIWHNTTFLDATQTPIAATAAGLTLGWGVFTTIGIYARRPFALERHLARLRHSATATEIELPYDDSAIEAALQATIERNAVHDGFARLTLTLRADGRWSQALGSDLTIFAAPRTPLTLDGLKVMLSSYRLDARRPLAGVKTTSYLEHQWIWREAHERGFDEAIFCNSQGVLCEGARSNLFWVRGGELFTPALASGCLPGIARASLLEWAASLRIRVHEGAFSPQELVAADEVFLTSATSGPRAVQSFVLEPNETTETYASPGPVTQSLQERWQEEVALGRKQE